MQNSWGTHQRNFRFYVVKDVSLLIMIGLRVYLKVLVINLDNLIKNEESHDKQRSKNILEAEQNGCVKDYYDQKWSCISFQDLHYHLRYLTINMWLQPWKIMVCQETNGSPFRSCWLHWFISTGNLFEIPQYIFISK